MKRLRFRLSRLLARAAAILAGVALLGCSWARATFGDPPGPIDPATCGPGMEQGAGNGCYAVEGARVRDAGGDAP